MSYANGQILRLAWRDFVFDWRILLCYVIALIAVLAPLLVLLGLKHGLINTLTARLVESPRTRELVPISSRAYDTDWIATLRRRPDVAFAVPNTRAITAMLSLLRVPASGRVLRSVPMLPTAAGDPLLTGLPTPVGIEQIVLSQAAAEQLGVRVGDRLEARVGRRQDGADESVGWSVQVVAIAPRVAIQGDAAFVALPLLEATEDYRDGVAVDAFGTAGDRYPPNHRREYAKFRLYARSIYDVTPLERWLRAQGVEVRTRAEDIEAMILLGNALTKVFWLIAGIGVTGFAISLAAHLIGDVERKRRELSVMRLLGFPAGSIALFPATQALLVGLCGTLVAAMLFFPFAALLNHWFAGSLRSGEAICSLTPAHFVQVLVGTLGLALLSALWAGGRVARIEPAEGLRER